MVGTKDLFADLQSPLFQRDRLGIHRQVLMHAGEMAERRRDIGMADAECSLTEGESALERLLRLSIPSTLIEVIARFAERLSGRSAAGVGRDQPFVDREEVRDERFAIRPVRVVGLRERGVDRAHCPFDVRRAQTRIDPGTYDLLHETMHAKGPRPHVRFDERISGQRPTHLRGRDGVGVVPRRCDRRAEDGCTFLEDLERNRFRCEKCA